MAGNWLLRKISNLYGPNQNSYIQKKSSFSRFSTDEKKEAFMFCLENRRFRELDQRFLELMEQLFV